MSSLESHNTSQEANEQSCPSFLRQWSTWIRILWVAFRLAAALLLAHQVDPFFYQGF